MINLLTSIGRFTMVLAAVLAVFIGFMVGRALSNDHGDQSLMMMGGIVGAFLGLIAAGTIFGVAAAIYDSQASLRALLAIAKENAKQNARAI